MLKIYDDGCFLISHWIQLLYPFIIWYQLRCYKLNKIRTRPIASMCYFRIKITCEFEPARRGCNIVGFFEIKSTRDLRLH